MSVLVTYKGAPLRQLDSGALTLLTAGRYMEGDVDIWNFGPESAVVSCAGVPRIAIQANSGRRLLTADRIAPGNVVISLVAGAHRFIPRGSAGLVTADGYAFAARTSRRSVVFAPRGSGGFVTADGKNY